MKPALLLLAPLALALPGRAAPAVPFVSQYAMMNADLKTMRHDTPTSSYYVANPTSSWAEILSDDKIVLVVQYNQIWLSSFDLDPARKAELVFSEDEVKEYVAAIDKYLAWAPGAISQPGSSNTDIVLAPSWPHPRANASLKFTLHAENGNAHYLAIAFCADVDGKSRSRNPVYFDQKNAAKLKDMLLKVGAGKVSYAAVAVGGPNPFAAPAGPSVGDN